MLNFDFLEVLGPVSVAHLVYDFSRKISNVELSLRFETWGNASNMFSSL